MRQHDMTLVNEYETGASEWWCAICDRRIVMQPKPYKKIILTLGNDTLVHRGIKENIDDMSTDVELPDTLAPFEDFMDGLA
jgi:hypothetical protein